ncbi:hypothetical protein GCM10008918_13040 [Lactobacillus kefiranofaciens subsp. kefiranofaciens]|uniref:LysR family transcriptional regulator n=1 Tax=Lactobacillus kefiranofaciens TaxID=267818 RepID=A0ABY0MH63_9LACO|nr:hypothetical protein FC93_GL001163 [Lactobacillus kefiranofaciens subsp. kefiranofaciens DSM 5016 = JCM 6985]SDA64424.1 hypothetical protein SAMN02983011_01892 [Lactobacillus kefiranofaciens]
MVKNKAALMLTLDKIANISKKSNLTFRPIAPVMQEPITMIWKRSTNLSPVAELFLKLIKRSIIESKNILDLN